MALPRDRGPRRAGRMYRRTRSISRSRICRTPSDRVPGCQSMPNQRERHLPLLSVTSYGTPSVTNDSSDSLTKAPRQGLSFRPCGWSVRCLRCSRWVSGCSGHGGPAVWPVLRARPPRQHSAGTRPAERGTPMPMTGCHWAGPQCPATGRSRGVLTTMPSSSASSTAPSAATANRATRTNGNSRITAPPPAPSIPPLTRTPKPTTT